MNPKIRAHLALLTITLIFGFHYVIAKAMMPQYLEPRQLLFLRVSGGLVLFFIWHQLFVRERVEKKDLLRLALHEVL